MGCLPEGNDDSCKCCCDPKLPAEQDTCKKISDELTCQPNTGQCTGQERGSCCGCTSDAQCGDPELVGCGLSTCCSARPQIELVYPEPTEIDACRNTLISIAFDQKMNGGSFNGNIIVAGDYGASLCPTGTELLTELAFNLNDGNWLQRAWHKIRQWLANISGQEATAAGNFCVVKGETISHDILDNGVTKTIAQFIIDTPLDPTIRYHVIVQGDKSLNSSSGVLSATGVGLNGQNWDTVLPPLSIFNGITYPRAQIWSFVTGDQICQIDEVEVVPSQHLFQRPFVDYVFEARAKTSNGQYIQRITNVYNWQWDWGVENVNTATVKYERETDNFATVTSGNRGDAQTWLKATATITQDVVTPLATAGRSIVGQARIILFFCSNPWPAVNDPNMWPIRWTDRNDNCDVCRGKYSYQSGGGLIEVLKDLLFSREDRPLAPTVWTVTNDSQAQRGGQAVIDWTVAKDFTYKLYYGQQSGRYDTSLVLTGPPFTVTGLKNDQTYYFVMTSINDKRVESEFSEVKSLIVKDVKAPATPTNFSAEVNATNDQNLKIIGQWTLELNDIVKYIVEYGPNQSPAIKADAGLNNGYTVQFLHNLTIQDYYIRVMAVDAAGNASQPGQLFCARGCADVCDCT
ncbi:MAG: hypothetical protein UT42_C0008G0009 [Candidatus Falkowbacteria bacterium GW2011_GWA2_39_24]|uniref:Fibronectin type-III domain-containing protein n=1 Tax=Candidatus Falkowbacteria bacterium GW2011_GWA2_39_24 TaxID=1618634 RepID=A0A0G0NGB4_9BACT|nr:MAG: hypothetical protein UT42_C0008G0009 [Candidatus Falkowbacteria bacterium GW2011_GWA2_39_24]